MLKIYGRWASLAFAIILLAACSSDDKDSATDNNKVSEGIQFKVDFLDYNEDTETQATRGEKNSNDTISRKIIDIGNGISAEVIVQRDTTKTTQKEKTRTLEDGTYTMLAYQGGVYKGEVSGTIESHSYQTGELDPWGYPIYNWGTFFHYADGRPLELEPGTYDFVLYNNKVTRNGNNLTVNSADMETALIGRTTYTVPANPTHQQVSFQMKHVSARIRYKWVGYDNFVDPAGTLTSTHLNTVSTYNAATGTWTSTSTASRTESFSSFTGDNYPPRDGTHTVTSNYTYYLPPVDIHDLAFKMGTDMLKQTTTYNGRALRLDAKLSDFVPSIALDANTSHLVTFKFISNAIYLMSDGSTGHFKDTTYGGGSKTPVGIVVSQSRKLAVALFHTDPGSWYRDPNTVYINGVPRNSVSYRWATTNQMMDDMDGYKYTWEAAGSADNATIKTNHPYYNLFNHVRDFNAKLAAKGITLSGTLAGKKWYMPTVGEWKYVFTALALSDVTKMTNQLPSTGAADYFSQFPANTWLLRALFLQAGGDDLFSNDGSTINLNTEYWVVAPQTAFQYTVVIYAQLGNNNTAYFTHAWYSSYATYPFIHY